MGIIAGLLDPRSRLENTGVVDNFKLVSTEKGVGFIWDGSFDFDLSLFDLGSGMNTVGSNEIDSIWKKIKDNPLNTYGSKEELANAIGSFNQLSRNGKAIEDLFGNNNAPGQSLVNSAIGRLKLSMSGVQSSGLLVRTDATTENGVAIAERPGIRLFEGDAAMSNDFGIGVRTWKAVESLRQHFGIDVYALAGPQTFIANEAGSLGLSYSSATGLGAEYTIRDGTRQLRYDHASASTIKTMMGLFGSTGVSFDGDMLQGITRNMKIAELGSTGTETSGPHGHIEYLLQNTRGRWESGDPANYFGSDYFSKIDFDSGLVSGWQKGQVMNPNYQLNESDLFKAYLYSMEQKAAGVKEKYYLDYQSFITNPDNQKHFGNVDWVKLWRLQNEYRRFGL